MTTLIVQGRIAEKVIWSWFNQKSMLWLRVYKVAPSERDRRPWMLTKGAKGEIGFKVLTFDTLGDLLGSLYDHEMDALVEKTGVEPMMLIAMAAEEGELA